MAIHNLNAAQSLFLMHPFLARDAMLVKHALLDLTLRGVLNVYQENRLPHRNSRQAQPYIFVGQGPFFSQYTVSRIEAPLTRYFQDGHEEVRARLLYQEALEACYQAGGYKHQYLAPALKQAGYLKAAWLLEPIGLYQLTEAGQRLRATLQERIQQAETHLEQAREQHLPPATEAFAELGPSILLSEALKSRHLEQLGAIYQALSQQQAPPEAPAVNWEWLYDRLYVLVALDFLTDDLQKQLVSTPDSTATPGAAGFGGDLGGDIGGGGGGGDGGGI